MIQGKPRQAVVTETGEVKRRTLMVVEEKPRILFMGTPEFAVPSLRRLIDEGYNLLAVVTQPDRPRGRGRKSEASPVKRTAEKYGIPVLQPDRVRDESFLELFREIAPDMVVLVAFGQILPGEVIDFPKLGCLNVHPSLLPLYRGAAPINWALIRGEEKTGVTVIVMDRGVDSGDILLQEEFPIGPEDTYDTLHDRLAEEGARLLVEAVEGVVKGTAKRTTQDHTLATYAPRLKKEDCHIDWNADVKDIVNLIRGLSSSPGAYAYLRDKQIKIFFARGEEAQRAGSPGAVVQVGPQELRVAARDGFVYPLDVQLEGRKRMGIHDFLKGYRVMPGEILR